MLHNYSKNTFLGSVNKILKDLGKKKPKYKKVTKNYKLGVTMLGYYEVAGTYFIEFKFVGNNLKFTTDKKDQLKHAIEINENQDGYEAWIYCQRVMETI